MGGGGGGGDMSVNVCLCPVLFGFYEIRDDGHVFWDGSGH